jgi:hypothetical protein
MSELTRGRSGRWLLLAMALGLLITLAVVAPASDAAGHEVVIETDAGVILLSTGPDDSDNWIRYYQDPASPLNVEDWDEHQAIGLNRCNVTANGPLMSITDEEAGSQIGLVSNGFGVKDKGNCSSSQGRVNDGQELTFALDTTSTDSPFDDTYTIDHAEIDVEGKHSANLEYSLDGGNNFVPLLPPLENSKDNGPDSGIGDNEIGAITSALGFQSIIFRPEGSSLAAIAIEGGGDGTIIAESTGLREELEVNQTLFHLQRTRVFDSGDLNCDDFDEPATIDAGVNGPADSATLSRSTNNLYSTTCVKVAYSFRIETDRVLFDVNLDGQEDANFLIRIDWDPTAKPINPFDTPHREINFFPDSGDDAYVSVEACEDLLVDGDPNGLDPHPNDVYQHPSDGAGGVVPWCLAGERLVLLESGEWQQIQWYDGGTDPYFR